MEIIRSKDNETFKFLKKLKTKKYRDSENLFLAEGVKFLDFNIEPQMILINEEIDIDVKLEERLAKFNCRKILLDYKLFSQITSQENSQGVIIVYKSRLNLECELDDNIVVLNKISDPGNMGTIIRVADAAGFKDIIVTKGSVDCYNEKTVRSSMGSILSMNIHYIDEKDLLTYLKKKNYKLIATALEKDSIPYTSMKLENKNAIIFGNEGNGIEKEIIEACEEKIIIPIYGSAESLNVAMASGIVLYEVRNKLNK
ncbi:RNA methyltransferase, TrmH family [Cetobacterium ceti]|uniref:RNA methyltransferase, TrmH family n=1 Tax=Cetobacterium ceti TaxID=180163 RepID=A0A1T4PS94_9FUSO|nr:RNA methyltransferase [Cetobacterium ceti]SJZ94126.1 RNA methyltransferase, TrmH family [Cetobacterium ceti]